MKKIILLLSIGITMNIQGLTQNAMADNIKFASIEKAKQLLSEEDSFTRSWSPFDIDSRMGKKNSTKEELFKFIDTQVREWSAEEQEIITELCNDIDNKINSQNLKVSFPQEIYFVKTTGAEEGGATGYTRNNYIVLKEGSTQSSKEDLEHLIVHELFHVLTRANPEFRKEMYEIIGFSIAGSISYPDNIKSLRITNPDAPQTDSYINLKADKKDISAMMVLYANGDYNGGSFFDYLNIGFLSLVGDQEKKVEMVNGEPVIYTMKEIENFFEQVGRNTNYIIHPEEIMAENFTHAILNTKDLKDPILVEKIKQTLRK